MRGKKITYVFVAESDSMMWFNDVVNGIKNSKFLVDTKSGPQVSSLSTNLLTVEVSNEEILIEIHDRYIFQSKILALDFINQMGNP